MSSLMSAFLNSGRSNHQILSDIRVRFRPILLKNSKTRRPQDSLESFGVLDA